MKRRSTRDPAREGLSAPDAASRFQPVIEHAPFPMAAVNGVGHVVGAVNLPFCRLMERTREELVGHPFLDRRPEQKACASALDRAVRTGEPATHAELQLAAPEPIVWTYTLWPVVADGSPAAVLVQVTETAWSQEKTRAMNEALMIGLVRQHELTEAADASNTNLAATDTAKNQFMAVLSHELRTPLGIILLWTQILQRPERSEESLRNGLGIILRSSRALARLIEDLLDVHRIAAGKLRLELAEVDLRESLRAVVDSMAPASAAKEIRLVRDLDGEPVLLSGDRARLEQVFGNLLDNAVKFTPKGGGIRVTLRRVDARVEVSVSDTGEGVSAEALLHIFERFRQDDPLTSQGGLGLGLAIAKQLVELHGGTIAAASPGKGAGATFTVSLPLAPGSGKRPRA